MIRGPEQSASRTFTGNVRKIPFERLLLHGLFRVILLASRVEGDALQRRPIEGHGSLVTELVQR